MKTVSIRELHARTGALVRDASRHGEIWVTDRGRVVARIVPEAEAAKVPYFARRRYVNPGIKGLIESGRLGRGGTDSTTAISEDREHRS
jgi:prevent-host-death family protein